MSSTLVWDSISFLVTHVSDKVKCIGNTLINNEISFPALSVLKICANLSRETQTKIDSRISLATIIETE